MDGIFGRRNGPGQGLFGVQSHDMHGPNSVTRLAPSFQET